MIFDDATRAQIIAARPDASTWLGANAGSGKTRVLTDRVARLLLDGVRPQNILCLTYTKAAASEMQNRLFRRLGSWAMLEDDALRTAMAELGITAELDRDHLRQARRLFALAIETPGGLKIQTIHSFCAALLRRFPLEAGVSPQFTEIEDRAADLLRSEILDEMASGPEAPLVAALARVYSGEDFGRLTRRIVGMQEGFGETRVLGDFLRLLGQREDLTAEGIEQAVFLGGEAALLETILPPLLAKGGNDAKAGEKLRQMGPLGLGALPVLEDVFLTGAKVKTSEPFSAKIGSFPTKPTQALLGAAMDPLEALMRRVEAARDARLSLQAAEQALTLHRFAQRFLIHYAQAKELRGWLDFDDLILKARMLLRAQDVAAWVLYRIDGGIDHILVDEAQDTSPQQWDVIEALTEEFSSGKGAREDVARTLFVVGDKKQSIYSFQGADPRAFDKMGATFHQRITDAGQPFQHRSLDYSFRSSSAILRFVDTVFDPRRRPDFGGETGHLAFKDKLPGRVDLWPVIPKAADEEDRHWTDPLDRRGQTHHTVLLAEKIAAQIRAMTDPARPVHIADDGGPEGAMVRRPVRPGDFLILVQRRSALFSEIIRACKAAGLPIAGADRLKVGAELAVKDIAALLSFLASSDDSLALATALKSPLFGWSEKALFQLAHGRKEKHLWQALRTRRAEFAETHAILRDLRDQVDFLRPYDLIERILTRHDGRRRLLARLGPEAEDGINALLSQALAYERNAVPSLTGFIEWMQTDEVEIKRQIDSASNQIRVMTVHGAKGLEAPIVILPDTVRAAASIRSEVIAVDDVPFWKPPGDALPASLRQSIDDMKAAEEAERLRLLYVALTRAEKWLIIAAAGDLPKDGSDWYQIAAEAMDHLNTVQLDDGTRRFQTGDWDAAPMVEAEDKSRETRQLEPFFGEPAPVFCHPPAVLSPSDLGGPKALPGDQGEESETAMTYGSLVHGLLERMPGVADHEALARTLSEGLAEDLWQRALAEAKGVFADPSLAHLFNAEALVEVPVTGAINGQRLHGVVDRLLISPDAILLVDYKTNRHVPATPAACPEGILRQMGAYADILSQIYPGRRIDTAILWTAAPLLMPLPHDILSSALARSPYLDVTGVRS